MAVKKSSRRQFLLLGTVSALLLLTIIYLLSDNNFAVLNPKGTIAEQQKNLLIFSTALMLLVIVPVFFMAFYFAYKYRETNKKSRYTPNWDSNKKLEFAWWFLPFIIIFVLGVTTYRTSHSLDPFRPIATQNKPLNVQVVALQWKWLFIYPEHNVASLNYLQLPQNTPINFSITSDAPMNSFWIPQLGSQIYAMPGMSTKLHLLADTPGTYRGVSANISGEGFAGMDFKVNVDSEVDFLQWIAKSKTVNSPLNGSVYEKLVQPSSNSPEATFSSVSNDLYDRAIMKYMLPTEGEYSGGHSH